MPNMPLFGILDQPISELIAVQFSGTQARDADCGRNDYVESAPRSVFAGSVATRPTQTCAISERVAR